MVELAEGAPGVRVHAPMNASTASIWASRSRSSRLEAIVHGFIRYLSIAGELVAAAHERRRARRRAPGRAAVTPCPRVTAAIGRSGATIGTREKSNGLPTSATASTGRSGVAGVREQREDPAQAPADQAAPAARRRRRTWRGSPRGSPRRTSARARACGRRTRSRRSRRCTSRCPAEQEVLGERAAAAQVEAERRRGERRHEQHRAGWGGFRGCACSTGR